MNSFVLAFVAALAASASLDVLAAFASLNSLDSPVGDDPVRALDFTAVLTRLDAFALDFTVALTRLDAFALDFTVAAFVSLDSLDAFARFDSLDALTGLDALEALACLDPLDCFPGLDALDTLHTFAAKIAVLLLKFRILERHVAVMSRVELPVLVTSEIDLVEFAVEHGVGLDRRKASISPIVVVIQRRPHEERRSEPERRPDGPPRRIPEEWRVCRRPVAAAVNDQWIIDRNVNVIRLRRFDDDVFGRPHVARAWRRGDPSDPLLLARLQIAGRFCLAAQRLNCILYVVWLSQKGLAELVGPVQLIVHHRKHLRD